MTSFCIVTAAEAPEIADLMARAFTDYSVPFSAGRIAAAIKARNVLVRVVRFSFGGIVAFAAAEMQASLGAATRFLRASITLFRRPYARGVTVPTDGFPVELVRWLWTPSAS